MYDGGARVDTASGNIIRPAPDLLRAVVVRDLGSSQGNNGDGEISRPMDFPAGAGVICEMVVWAKPLVEY